MRISVTTMLIIAGIIGIAILVGLVISTRILIGFCAGFTQTAENFWRDDISVGRRRRIKLIVGVVFL